MPRRKDGSKTTPDHLPPEDGRFKPGHSGNPGGRAVGTRNAIQKAFLLALARDFDKHGAEAIRKCRERKPDAYVKALVTLMPKELEVKRPLEEINESDLVAAIALLQSVIAAQAAGAGTGDAQEPPQTH